MHEDTYTRVIPRDLFNESKLLKCLGQLSLLVLDGVDANGRTTPTTLKIESDGGPFIIEQDQSDGNIYCRTVVITIRDVLIWVSSRLNCKSPFPLEFHEDGNGNIGPVFNDDGTLSDEFIAIC